METPKDFLMKYGICSDTTLGVEYDKKITELLEEYAELKKKLRTAPPKGTTVRDKKNGRIYYSAGFLSPDGFLRVHHTKDNHYASDAEIIYWEEIEVKVK